MTPKEQRDDDATVRLPRNLAKEMDVFIGTRGFTSRAEVAKHAIREFLEKHELEKPQLPRFDHFNMGTNGVRITDRKLRRIAEITFKPQGIRCDLDESDSCEHIEFALSVPEVQEIIRKRRKEGWKLP